MKYRSRSSFGITCIIPFYNEGERIVRVLAMLSRTRNLAQIICVDDGSSDDMHSRIRELFPQVEVIRSEQNLGKTRAVALGLAHATGEGILLCDADLREINVDQLERAIDTFANFPSIDMLILRRATDLTLCRLTRLDIVISGERLVRKDDLKCAVESGAAGYQLELAINDYMEIHKKIVFWMPLVSKPTLKMEKYGRIVGLGREWKMYKHLMQYKDPAWFFWNLLTFCRQEYQTQTEMGWATN